MFEFSIIVKNNTAADVNIPLMDVSGIRGSFNSRTKFSVDLSAANLAGIQSVSIQVRSNGATDIITYTAPLLTPTIGGVVSALNSLNVGLFWSVGNTVYTANSLYTYTNLIIGDTTVATYTIVFDSTASITHTITMLTSGMPAMGSVDWGDGNTDNFSTINPVLTHNYAVPGVYTASVYIQSSLADVGKVDVSNSEVLAITGIGALPNLTVIVLTGNELMTLDISQNPLLSGVIVNINNLPTSVVNALLIALDGFGLNGGLFDSTAQVPPAPPSGAGSAAKLSLQGKGWTVNTD